MLTYVHVWAKEAQHSPGGNSADSSTNSRGGTSGSRGGGTSGRGEATSGSRGGVIGCASVEQH